MLSCVDEGIKNVSTALTARGMLKDTFIVFTTVRIRHHFHKLGLHLLTFPPFE
jgi:hypothetical protein